MRFQGRLRIGTGEQLSPAIVHPRDLAPGSASFSTTTWPVPWVLPQTRAFFPRRSKHQLWLAEAVGIGKAAIPEMSTYPGTVKSVGRDQRRDEAPG